MADEKQKEQAFREIWTLQGQLFEVQKDFIVWAREFVPDDKKTDYNMRIVRINHILQKIEEQQAIINSKEPGENV